jgi:DNA helicase-2/ATP-dependent DNA helicase PcrA
VSFYERREVKDLLAYLRLLANPADDQAFARIVNVPRRGIGEVSVTMVAEAARRWGVPLLEAARRAGGIEGIRPGLREGFQRFADLVVRLRGAVAHADPATALEMVIATTGYEAWLAEEGVEGVERLDNVRELVAGAAAWAEVAEVTTDAGDEGGSMLERYLTQSTLVTPTDEFGGANASGVTLLTVHMAKGLEWPVVALAGLEDGLFPLARSAGEPGGLEEERRLCYVGLTRARERLYLSWARTRYRNGRLELAEPSRFLDAVPQGVVEERSTTPSWSRGGMVSGRGAGPGRARWPRVEEPAAVFDDDSSQDAPRYARGERVRHRKFGGGVVREVSGMGRNLKVKVEFDDADVGTKQLLVAYAALERDWEGDSA